jgi:hypothetical protein
MRPLHGLIALDNEHQWQKVILQKKGVFILIILAEQPGENVSCEWNLSENPGQDTQTVMAAGAYYC